MSPIVIINELSEEPDDEPQDDSPRIPKLRPRCIVGLHGGGQIAVLQSYDECLTFAADGLAGSERIEFTRILDDGRPARMSVERWMIGPICELAAHPDDPPPQGA